MEFINATDSEDELPEGYEERVTLDGRIYYANHIKKTTQWEHPITKKQKIITGELPYGWERMEIDNKIIFVDHLNKRSSYTDPRLAFAKSKEKRTKMSNYIDENSTALDLVKNRDLSGSVAIVTGANRGVGFEIVRALAYSGCYVIMACRNVDAGMAAYESLLKERSDVKCEIIELNLASLISVKQFVDKIKSRNIKIQMLFLNAATFETDYKLSNDNIEFMFQVNYLAQFYLTRLLLDNLKSTQSARIVILSCESHRGGNLSKSDISTNQLNVSKNDFHFLQVYCNTKLCSILFANELNRRLNKMKSIDLICKSCHPGNLLPTKLFSNWVPFRCISLFTSKFVRTLAQAAANPIYLATTERHRLNQENFYWNNFYECVPSTEAQDSVLAYRLWEISENILIDRTSSFDNFLSEGDQFSSYTKIEPIILVTSPTPSPTPSINLPKINSKINEAVNNMTPVSN